MMGKLGRRGMLGLFAAAPIALKAAPPMASISVTSIDVMTLSPKVPFETTITLSEWSALNLPPQMQAIAAAIDRDICEAFYGA